MVVKDFIGKFANHNTLGRVYVDSAPKGSKKLVNIVVKQRGRGWDEITQSYKRFFIGAFLQKDGNRSLRWGFTTSDQFGHEDTVRIDTLKLT